MQTSGIVTEDALLGCFPCPQYPEVFANVNERPRKLFYVCRVCIQDLSFSNAENDTMKLSLNEAKLTGLWAKNSAAIQQVFFFKI